MDSPVQQPLPETIGTPAYWLASFTARVSISFAEKDEGDLSPACN